MVYRRKYEGFLTYFQKLLFTRRQMLQCHCWQLTSQRWKHVEWTVNSNIKNTEVYTQICHSPLVWLCLLPIYEIGGKTQIISKISSKMAFYRLPILMASGCHHSVPVSNSYPRNWKACNRSQDSMVYGIWNELPCYSFLPPRIMTSGQKMNTSEKYQMVHVLDLHFRTGSLKKSPLNDFRL